MNSKRVVIDTDTQRGALFRIDEAGGRYFVYRVEVGLISNSPRRIGDARVLSDALELAKGSLGRPVRNVSISEW
jgi:hypothetical protein